MPTHGKYWDTWVNQIGPGDSRPTAIQIIKDEHLEGKLKDKTVVITGASAGIGVETLRALHFAGATVFATSRNEQKLEKAIKEVQASDPGNDAIIIPIVMEQESLESVRNGAKQILEKSGGKVNILINNAGIMACPEGKTVDGYERQFAVNHLSHFLLFQLLKPVLLAGSSPAFNSRVVNVSSVGHRFGPVRLNDYSFSKSPYVPFEAYGQSKTANIWMTNEIERRYGSSGLHGLSIHPGFIRTGLTVYIDPKLLESFVQSEPRKRAEKSVEQGAATQVYAAVSKDLEGQGGKWLSNCEEWGPGAAESGIDEGHADHAFDPEGEKQLWKDSLEFVGLKEDS